MKTFTWQGKRIEVHGFREAERLIMQLSDQYAGDITPVSTKGKGRNRCEYYNYPCSFDIETTTIKPGELDYIGGPEDPPIAFPYLFQWNIYGRVIMCRHYSEAVQIFGWISQYFRLAENRRMVIFDHNLGYEEHFFRGIWKIDGGKSFALDDHHPVTIATTDGFLFRDSYKMSNMSLAALSKDWSKAWIKAPEIMDYSKLRTPYTRLSDNVYIYSALDVLALSDAISGFLAARSEPIWTRCPTSTSFIRAEYKTEIGIGAKVRTPEQHAYFKTLKEQRVTAAMFSLLLRLARGGNTHANRFITGLLLKNVAHFDIVSSYPAQMVLYPEFPLGEWAPLDPGADMETIELFEASGQCCMFDAVLINARIKEGVTVPYIPVSKIGIVRGSGMRCTDNGRYLSGLEAIRISIFGIEWHIIKSQYDFDDAIIIRGWFTKKGYLPDILRRFILKYYAAKTELKNVEGSEVEYQLAKAAVNSIFGVAYTNPLRDLWEVTDHGIFLTPPKDPEEFLEKYQKSISYFLPYAWGAMTAALGRVYLQKMIDAVGSDFVYCDTDSVFCLHPEESRKKIRSLEAELREKHARCGLQFSFDDIKGRPHELGTIDEEPICEYFKTYGAKKYITVENGELSCTIAGVPKKAGSRLIGTPDRFQLGFNFRGADTGKNCLWYNDDPGRLLHDAEGRPIEIHSNVAMLPCDYLLSLSNDYTECLSIEGNFHWNFKEADKNTINEEDF